MTCTHTLGGHKDALVCTRTTPHDVHAPGGHTYSSAWLEDQKHDDVTSED